MGEMFAAIPTVNGGGLPLWLLRLTGYLNFQQVVGEVNGVKPLFQGKKYFIFWGESIRKRKGRNGISDLLERAVSRHARDCPIAPHTEQWVAWGNNHLIALSSFSP